MNDQKQSPAVHESDGRPVGFAKENINAARARHHRRKFGTAERSGNREQSGNRRLGYGKVQIKDFIHKQRQRITAVIRTVERASRRSKRVRRRHRVFVRRVGDLLDLLVAGVAGCVERDAADVGVLRETGLRLPVVDEVVGVERHAVLPDRLVVDLVDHDLRRRGREGHRDWHRGAATEGGAEVEGRRPRCPPLCRGG